MKNVMNTYNKRIFDPWNITCDDIDIIDIAHALSLLCRGCGHVNFFYSVGLHCLNCATEAKARGYSKDLQLACLLHDASEAYISDIIRPVKIHLTQYQQLEDKIISTIYDHFKLQLSAANKQLIKEIDDQMLANEMPIIFSSCQLEKIPKLACTPTIKEMPFKDVEQQYLDTYQLLI